MENEQKDSMESPVSRRAVLQFMAVGILTIAAGLHIAYRRWKPKNKLGVTEITIEGPFEDEVTVTPKELGPRYKERISSDFKLLQVMPSEGKREDKMIIVFTFSGKEIPDRKMKVKLTVYDQDNNEIGWNESVFGDPRIKAREANADGGMYIMEPVSSLRVRVDREQGRNISQISHIEIFAMNVENL